MGLLNLTQFPISIKKFPDQIRMITAMVRPYTTFLVWATSGQKNIHNKSNFIWHSFKHIIYIGPEIVFLKHIIKYS